MSILGPPDIGHIIGIDSGNNINDRQHDDDDDDAPARAVALNALHSGRSSLKPADFGWLAGWLAG